MNDKKKGIIINGEDNIWTVILLAVLLILSIVFGINFNDVNLEINTRVQKIEKIIDANMTF